MSCENGLSKQKGFTPEKSSPPETKQSRPKHDNEKIKRNKGSMK